MVWFRLFLLARSWLLASQLAGLGLLAPAVAAHEGEQTQPNILWLTCEDLSPRLGCYGDTTVPTPHIDRLASAGVRFTRAFTATGVCAPSRHTMITGVYPMQSGAQYMRTVSRSKATQEITDAVLQESALERPLYEATPPDGVRCFTEYLRQRGYYCTNNSKTDYQFTAPVTAWDESSPQAHYRNRGKHQPFFAVFNQTVTHESGVHGTGRSPRVVERSSVLVPSFLPDTAIVREDIARHYDNIAALDQWVGEKLAELEQAGLSDSTIVFFFSDHGDGLPRHKRWVYDSGTWVPMVVRFPDGYQAGSTDESLMSFVDLAPTMVELVGIERPDYMLGRVCAGPDIEPPPEYVFMHRDRMDDFSHDTIRSARGKRFRYVRNYRPNLPYLQPLPYRDRAATMSEIYRLLQSDQFTDNQWQWSAHCKPLEELYDTQADPEQICNLASDPKLADKLGQMRLALDQWIARIDDPLATPEVEVLRTRVWPPDGMQPVTAAPSISVHKLSAGKHRLAIECATAGASIGYRFSRDHAWMVYNGPFETTSSQVQVNAHRLGWKPAQTDWLDIGN